MSVPRIIDSSCNRLAEALRVMEDLARFTAEDVRLAAELKDMRHSARGWSARWPQGWAVSSRDVPGDVGTTLEAEDESRRSGLWDVAAAAGNRAAEAMRTIEEIAKTFDVELAREVEALRYRCYDLDASLRHLLASRRARQWTMCILLSEAACRRPWGEVASAVIEAGVDCIQLREKDLPDRELLDRTRTLVALARPLGCSVIVNDRLDIALAADADGVHLGHDDLPIKEARRAAGHQLLLGASTHGLEEAGRAIEAGADYCGVGPMFTSSTKPGLDAAGPARIAEFIEAWPGIPHLAIGGIGPSNLPSLLEAGCRGVACCEAVCGSEDPAAAASALLDRLHACQPA